MFIYTGFVLTKFFWLRFQIYCVRFTRMNMHSKYSNMKTTIFFLSVLFFTTASILAGQTAEWEKIYIKNVGYLSMPPTMEVQSGRYKVIVDDVKKIYGYDGSQLTIQQKGLNELGQNGFQKYARILIETTVGSFGDYEKLDFDISGQTAADIDELNTTCKQMVAQGFLGTDLKLVEWYPIQIEKVNGYSSLHIKYKRRLGDQPLVMVNMYVFMNNDRKHTVTLSYRINEESFWKTDLEKALASLRITYRR